MITMRANIFNLYSPVEDGKPVSSWRRWVERKHSLLIKKQTRQQ